VLRLNNRNGGDFLGSFSFTGGETGSDIAGYLLGAPSGYAQASPQVLDARRRYAGAFVQDSFRIRSNLTLNIGLRWEFSTPWYDTQNKIVALVPGEQSTQYPTAPEAWCTPEILGFRTRWLQSDITTLAHASVWPTLPIANDLRNTWPL
jgi:hypothetical protein